MSRTTPTLVQGIIQTEPGVDLTPFIDTATELTTDVCGASNYTDVRLELIERWLSAHFYAIFDSQLTMARAGTAAVGFQYKISYGLKNTMWGQQAMILDTDGNLAAYDNTAQTKRKINIDISWLGHRHRGHAEQFGDEWADLTTEQ